MNLAENITSVFAVSGIYAIVNTLSDKRYVGSSHDIQKRWIQHRNLLRNGKHHSNHLQCSYNSYGESSFDFVLLEACSLEILIEREQYWIDHYQSFLKTRGYNTRLVAESNAGLKASDETRQKLRDAIAVRFSDAEYKENYKKIHQTPQAKINHTAAAKARMENPETREKLRKSSISQWADPEARAKIMKAFADPDLLERKRQKTLGTTHSDATKNKISRLQVIESIQRVTGETDVYELDRMLENLVAAIFDDIPFNVIRQAFGIGREGVVSIKSLKYSWMSDIHSILFPTQESALAA